MHFGSAPPQGKASIRLPPARAVAEHHGKVFWCQAGFRYLNLTEDPTTLARAPDFEAELNIFFPQCAVHAGDQFRIGDTVLEIQNLVPPERQLPLVRPLKETNRGLALRIAVREIGPQRPRTPAAIELAASVRHLRDRHEIFRCGADWLRKTLRKAMRPSSAGRGCPLRVGVWHLSQIASSGTARPPDFRVPSNAPAIDWADWLSVAHSEAALLGWPLAIHEKKAAKPRSAMAVAILQACDDPRARLNPVSDIVAVDLGVRSPTETLLGVMRDFSEEIVRAVYSLEICEKVRGYELRYRAALIAQECFHDSKHWCDQAERKVGEACSPHLDLVATKETVESAKPLLKHLKYMIAAGQRILEWEPVPRYAECDLAHEVSELVPVFSDLCDVRCIGPQQHVRFWGDPFSLWRAAYNLIHNAVRKARQARRERAVVGIWVGIEERRYLDQALPFVALIIADNGPGMPRAALQTIFDGQFVNADGRGLGTAVVADQVRRHRGRIEVVSEPGTGTAIGVLLPYVQKVGQDQLPEESVLEPYADSEDAGGFVRRWGAFEAACQESPIYRRIREALQ